MRRCLHLPTQTIRNAWPLFHKADGVQPGAYAALDAKALKLTGGAASPLPPGGRSVYAWVMDQGQADLFVLYCTNAVAAQKELPRLKVVQIPPELQVSAAYGMTVRASAPPTAHAFTQSPLTLPAQAVFKRLGFALP